MTPRPTAQDVHSPTFHPAPFDHSLSIPGLYEYHAKNSPEHPIFTYTDTVANVSHDVVYAEAWKSICTIAYFVSQHYRNSQHFTRHQGSRHRPVIGVLALSDSLTYIYLLVAVMSMGYTAFPLSPRNSPVVTAHLLEATGAVQVYVSDDPAMQSLAKDSIKLLSEKGFEVQLLSMFKFDSMKEIGDQSAVQEGSGIVDIKDDEVTLILHSSGTTTFPKPVRVTRRSLVNSSNIPCFGEVDLAGKRIAAHTNPLFHAMGFATVIWPLTSGAIFALYKPTLPPIMPTPASFLKSWVADSCHIVFCIPVFIEAWARDPVNIPKLRALDGIVFSGASLNKHLGDMLAGAGVVMHPFWGSTEIGPATLYIPRDVPPSGQWEYFKLSPHIEFIMKPQENMEGIFEPIMIPAKTCFPNVLNSELDGRPVYAVGDLLEQHPTDPGRWKVFGRKDDLIILATGENVNPLPIEETLVHDKHIAAAIVFGQNHMETGVLIEPAKGVELRIADRKLEEFKDLIWPAVEKANAQVPAYAHIQRKRIIVTCPSKSLEYTPKGTPRRPICLQLYASEINAMYGDEEDASIAADRQFPDRI